MLFHLDINNAELAAFDPIALAAVTAELLRARRLGYHLIVISRTTARWLGDHVDLSQRDRAMLDRLAQEYAQTGALRRLARVYVSLSSDPALDLGANGNAISVFLPRLTQYRLLDRPILLIEDIESDGRLYEFLLYNHCNFHGCGHVCYELRHGGGDNLPKVFEREINERKIVCGVVDSDKNSPSASNTKLMTLLSMVRALAWPLGFGLSPRCREAENIVPFALIMSLPSGYKNNTNAVLTQVNRGETASGHAMENYYWFYFDLKAGLSADKFRRYSEDERTWIEAKLALAGVNPYNQSLSGYGDRVIRQLSEENKFLSELKKLTRQPPWLRVFAPFIDDLVWPFASSVKVIT